MTAPVPTPRLSPTAGLFNALVQLAIRLLDLRVLDLETEVAIATAENTRLQGGES